MDKALKSVLDWWEAAGVDVPPMPAQPPSRKSARLPANKGNAPLKNTATSPASQSSVIIDALPDARAAKTLAALKTAIENFDAGLLSDKARQSVFARGNPEADLMIIGEAPSREDEIAGQPFMGPEGQLLGKMLAAIGLGEADYYITTVVNWRPPQNRNPKNEDIALCRPFLHRHIELAAPKTILIVGGVALYALTGQTSIMKNRGQWQSFQIENADGSLKGTKDENRDIPALPIYPPTLLLSQPTLKKEAWRDLRLLKEHLK